MTKLRFRVSRKTRQRERYLSTLVQKISTLTAEPMVGFSVVATSAERDAVENLVIMRSHSKKGPIAVGGHTRKSKLGKQYTVGNYTYKLGGHPRFDKTSPGAMKTVAARAKPRFVTYLATGSRGDLEQYLEAIRKNWQEHFERKLGRLGSRSGELAKSYRFWKKLPAGKAQPALVAKLMSR